MVDLIERKKRSWKIDKIIIPKNIRPNKLLWHITYKCNLECKYCFINKEERKIRELEISDVIKIIHKVYNYGIRELGISGGEPFIVWNKLKSLLYEAIEVLKMPVAINTNGTLITDKHISFLGSLSRKISIDVSLDAPTREINDTLRGRGTFKRVINAIKLFKQLDNIDLGISMTITKENYHIIRDMFEFLTKNGVYRLAIGPVFPLGNCPKDLALEPKQLYEATTAAYEALNEYNLSVSFYLPFSFLINRKTRIIARITRKTESPISQFCGMGITKMHLAPNGEVIPCSFIREPVGNILFSDIDEIWHSNRMALYRDIALSRYGQCMYCPDSDICGGCPALAYAITGDMRRSDKYCWRYRGIFNG